MKDFLKYTFATMTGLILAFIALIAIGIISLTGMTIALTTEKPTALNNNSIVIIHLNGVMTEMPHESLFNILEDAPSTISLQQTLKAIAYAKNTEQIKGIHLNTDFLSATPAALQELRTALTDFKTSGKFITTYADNYTLGTYYVCSVADKMMLNPQGSIAWNGLSAETMFYKDLLEHLGIKMQTFKVGTYKSAVEPFTANQMSEANRKQTSAYLHSIWNNISQGVSNARGISLDTLNAYANRMLSFASAEELLQKHMIDTLIYEGDVYDYINRTYNSNSDFNQTSTHTLCTLAESEQNLPIQDIIAIYHAEGEITDRQNNTNTPVISAPDMCEDLRNLAEDNQIKAVVIRVNSPGGSAFGSEQIWHEVMKLKTKKPVIVSMGGYAASGGYYISCAADSIVAEPGTLTGSIGIFGMIPSVEGLTDKIGIKTDRVSTHSHAGINSIFRPLDKEEHTAIQASVERGYNLFVKRCAEGRNLSIDTIYSLAEGRVWTGAMAKERGLVDELGGTADAIRIAAQKAKLNTYLIQNYPEEKGWWEKLKHTRLDYLIQSQALQFLGTNHKELLFINQIKEQPAIQARIPYTITLNL